MSTPTDTHTKPMVANERIFEDPVAYLAAHGIESIIVVDTTLQVAA